MAIGVNTYKGLGVPRYGESEMRQESSLDVLTMTHSTLDGGRFLVLRNSVTEGSTVTDQDVAAITSAGGFQSLSGTTVQFELNTSGIFRGTTQIMGQNGGLIRQVISPTTGANFQVTSTMNGAIIDTGINDGTSMLVLCPVNPTPGFWFSVYVSTQDAVGDVQINTTADSSAKIMLPGYTSAVSTGDAIEPGTTLGNHYVTMTAVSSILWLADESNGYALAGTSDVKLAEINPGAWTSATTAA